MCLKWITWKSLLAFYQSCRLLLQKHTQQHSLSGCQQPSGCTDWLADQLACRPVCEQQLNDCVMPAILNCVGFLCIAERCRSRGKGDALWLPPTCRDWFGCAWKYVWNRTGIFLYTTQRFMTGQQYRPRLLQFCLHAIPIIHSLAGEIAGCSMQSQHLSKADSCRSLSPSTHTRYG